MKWTDQALQKLSDKMVYGRGELLHVLRSEKADLSDSAFRWTLYNLLQEQKLFKTGYDTYVTERGNRLLEGTNKTLCPLGPRRKEQ